MILVTLAYMEGWTYLRSYVRTVDDVKAIKPRFLASVGYHIFLTTGNLSTRRFWGDSDVYKRASLGKRAPSFPPRSKLKQRGFFATATLSKPASKA